MLKRGGRISEPHSLKTVLERGGRSGEEAKGNEPPAATPV